MDATQLPEARKPQEPITIPDRVALRAVRRFTPDPDTGCHVSTYSAASHGYAQENVFAVEIECDWARDALRAAEARHA